MGVRTADAITAPHRAMIVGATTVPAPVIADVITVPDRAMIAGVITAPGRAMTAGVITVSDRAMIADVETALAPVTATADAITAPVPTIVGAIAAIGAEAVPGVHVGGTARAIATMTSGSAYFP